MSCQWNIFSFPLKNFSSFKFRILNMVTVCCLFTHSFKIICIPQPVLFEVVHPLTVQRLSFGRAGEVDVWFTRCIEVWEPDIYELWALAGDRMREVHSYARVQISNDFIGETFHTHFFNAREVQIPFLGRRSVNRSFQWIDVPRPFGETGIATVAWTENLCVYPGVPTLLGFRMFLSSSVQTFRMFLSTCALLHAAPVKIYFNVIVLSRDILFRESSTRKLF